MALVRCRNFDCKYCIDGYCESDIIEINYDFECESREDREEEDDEEEDDDE